MKTTELVEKLKETFKDSTLQEIQFHNETTLEFEKESLKEALKLAKLAGFDTLMDLTAIDYLTPEIHTKIVYWLHNGDNLDRIRLTVHVKRAEKIPSVVDLWEGANWYERELYDMFGIEFENHPDLKRILMPDDWKGHPMRRDYVLTEVPVEFKHNVKPKVPSEIIPYVKIKSRRA